MKVPVRITLTQQGALARLLRLAPRTYDQLVAATGMSKPRVARWVKANAENIYVADWAADKNGRLFVPMFRWGAKPDAVRPGRVLTPAEQMRKLRANRKGGQ